MLDKSSPNIWESGLIFNLWCHPLDFVCPNTPITNITDVITAQSLNPTPSKKIRPQTHPDPDVGFLPPPVMLMMSDWSRVTVLTSLYSNTTEPHIICTFSKVQNGQQIRFRDVQELDMFPAPAVVRTPLTLIAQCRTPVTTEFWQYRRLVEVVRSIDFCRQTGKK